jgi:membrane-associated phospholipid phosphatase
MKNLKLSIPAVKRPILWIVLSLLVVAGIGIWGLAAPAARASQLDLIVWLNKAGNPALDHMTTVVEDFLSPKYAIVITVVLAVIFWIGTRSWLTGLGFGLAVAFAWLPVGALKVVFQEARPAADGLLREAVPSQDFSSFPSGHMSFAIGIVYAIYLIFNSTKAKSWVIALGAIFIVFVAYARLYVGVHYLTDVLASVFASIAGILIFNLVWTWFTQRVSSKK